jgi:hypothetical protein
MNHLFAMPLQREFCNALVTPLQNIQYYARRRQAGAYLLQQPWSAFAVTSYKNAIHFLNVYMEAGTTIVISNDAHRTHGRSYRMRASAVTVTGIFTVESLHDLQTTDSFQFAPDGVARTLGVGDVISYSDKFDLNPHKLQGRGLFISPTYQEAMKLLAYILRYNDNRLNQMAREITKAEDERAAAELERQMELDVANVVDSDETEPLFIPFLPDNNDNYYNSDDPDDERLNNRSGCVECDQ